MERYKYYGDSLDRYRKINLMNLEEVEKEIDFLISISENPSDELVDEIVSLMRVAKALGSRKEW